MLVRPRRLTALLAVAAAALLAPGTALAAGGGDWAQFGHDAAHSGVGPATTIGPGTVATLQRAFTTTLPGTADAPPVSRSGVATATGTKDLLFVNTTNGTVVAVDQATGAVVWQHQVGPGSCRINGSGGPCYTTSAPVVDPSGAFVYAYGLDGKVHKYAAGTGTETTTGGWPEVATLKPYDEKGSSDLALATARDGRSYLYMANGGYPGDRGDYQGHVTTIDLATGAQTVFNTVCSNLTVHFTAPGAGTDCGEVQSAVWARAGVVYDAATDLVYLVTGNSTFSPANHHWGDTVLALHPDGTGAGGGPVDSYTPTVYQRLDDLDQDLGSTAPAVVAAPAGSPVANLGVQGGKDGTLRLLDLGNLSRTGGPGRTGGDLQALALPQGGQLVFTQPTAWTDPATGASWVFVATGSGTAGLQVRLVGGTPQLVPQWTIPTGGTTPVVAGGVLYVETGGGLRALTPTTGAQLWTDGVATNVHWGSPVVTADAVFYPDGSGKLYGYRLPTGTPVASSVAVSTTPGPAVGAAGVGLFADVTPGAATGTVAFRVAGTTVAGCEARPVVGGRASCVATFPAAGAQTVTAAYSGDGATAPSTGSASVDVAPGAGFAQLLLGYLLAFARAVHLFGF